LGSKLLEKHNIVPRALPLIKNGCSNTKFNIESLKELLI